MALLSQSLKALAGQGDLHMTGPGSATAAAVSATATLGGAGGWAFFNSMLPPGSNGGEFFVDCGISIFGAFCYQFLYTQYQRQTAAEKGVPVDQRPKLDGITLGCAMCGAPMGTAALNYFIAVHGGVADAYSLPGYMAAGAIAPWLVKLFLAAIKKSAGLLPGAAP
jgi:hypothetical protein